MSKTFQDAVEKKYSVAYGDIIKEEDDIKDMMEAMEDVED
jgi:hypothetical protein